MTTKQSEEYFFDQCCKKMTTNIFVMAPRFCVAARFERLHDSHFSFIISAAARG